MSGPYIRSGTVIDVVKMRQDIDEVIDKVSELPEPYLENGYLFANGHPIVIRKIDESTNKAVYNLYGATRSIIFDSNTSIIGGGKDKHVRSTSITLDSGTVKSIYGGCFGSGTADIVNININGGIIKQYLFGGGYPVRTMTTNDNYTAMIAIIINDLGSTLNYLYGGGADYASVGSTSITINKGTINNVTLGSKRGSTSIAELTMNGGTINTLKAVEIGRVEQTNTIINDGEITKIYIGGDDNSTGSINHASYTIKKGKVGSLLPGTNNGSSYVVEGLLSGTFASGVVGNEKDLKDLGLSEESGGGKDIDEELYFNNRLEFPAIGKDKCLYIATDENIAYTFDTEKNIYKILRSSTTSDPENIEVIQSVLKK